MYLQKYKYVQRKTPPHLAHLYTMSVLLSLSLTGGKMIRYIEARTEQTDYLMLSADLRQGQQKRPVSRTRKDLTSFTNSSYPAISSLLIGIGEAMVAVADEEAGEIRIE
jgi:hypothetical protein